MPYIAEETLKLRFCTHSAVEKLINEGKCKNQKEAIYYIVKKARYITGFSSIKEKAYYQYIQFKSKHLK